MRMEIDRRSRRHQCDIKAQGYTLNKKWQFFQIKDYPNLMVEIVKLYLHFLQQRGVK